MNAVKNVATEIQPPKLTEIKSIPIAFQLGISFQYPESDGFQTKHVSSGKSAGSANTRAFDSWLLDIGQGATMVSSKFRSTRYPGVYSNKTSPSKLARGQLVQYIRGIGKFNVNTGKGRQRRFNRPSANEWLGVDETDRKAYVGMNRGFVRGLQIPWGWHRQPSAKKY